MLGEIRYWKHADRWGSPVMGGRVVEVSRDAALLDVDFARHRRYFIEPLSMLHATADEARAAARCVLPDDVER